MYLELKIFVVLNGLFSVLELETNRLVLSAPHVFLGLPWAFRLHKICNYWGGGGR